MNPANAHAIVVGIEKYDIGDSWDLNGPAVERLIAEHAVGRRDHSFLLWRLIVLNYWLAAFADGRFGRPPLVPSANSAPIRALSG